MIILRGTFLSCASMPTRIVESKGHRNCTILTLCGSCIEFLCPLHWRQTPPTFRAHYASVDKRNVKMGHKQRIYTELFDHIGQTCPQRSSKIKDKTVRNRWPLSATVAYAFFFHK